MASTADVFGMLAKGAQKELRSSISKQEELTEQEKILNKNVERVESYLSKTTTTALLGNHFQQRTQTLAVKQHCAWKRGEINNEIDQKYQHLRQQHQRTKIMQEKELQLQQAKESRNEQLETDDYNLTLNLRLGGK